MIGIKQKKAAAPAVAPEGGDDVTPHALESMYSFETLQILRDKNIIDIILQHCSTKLILNENHKKIS